MKLNQAKYKKKKRTCPMCKPYKYRWEDKRSVKQKRIDEGHLQELRQYGQVA